MKIKWHIKYFRVVPALMTLIASAPRSFAQADIVSISEAEFQRVTYSAHLLTQLAEKPELEASLQVLLELQRRNPAAEPTLLVDFSRLALQIYRSNAPTYVRTNGSRDEILASYLDTLRQIPARTNFNPAHLSLLNSLITRAQAPKDEREADLIHSGSQDLLSSQGDLTRRQALLDECTWRAQANASFRAALDGVLLPETFFSACDSPVEIIGSTNSPLHDNPTMQTLLALSVTNGGCLVISSNQLMNLFTNETQTFWDTINTNLALQREIAQSQSDLLAYLTNQTAITTDSQRLQMVRRGEARKIASASAAILVQSKLMAARDPLIKLPGQMQGCVEGLHKITDGLAAFGERDATRLAKVAASGNMLAGALGLFDMLFGGESPEEEIVREIGNIKTLLGDLSTNMNYRFDRVDQSLTTIFETLNDVMDKVVIIGGRIDHIDGTLDNMRLSLLDVQTDLFRIERNLATFHALDWRIELVEDVNYVRGFEARAGHLLPYTDNAPYDFLSFETAFFTHAYNRAAWEPLSLCGTLPFGDQYFYSQLSPGGTTNAGAEILNYVKKCLRQRLALAGFPESPILANPQDWSAGASAWMQLAVENPNHFRRYERNVGNPSRLDAIISKGRELTNFFRSLVFAGAGTNINWPLYDALDGFYVGKLTNFNSHAQSLEQQYAIDHALPSLEGWRAWALAVPRVTAASTELLESHAESPVVPAEFITSPMSPGVISIGGYSGRSHGLALQSGGRIVAWGNNDYGQSAVPSGLSNMMSVAAGSRHSVALRADNTVVAWGENSYGQGGVPALATNVTAIAAGGDHNLAVRADGRVVGWGYNYFGQVTGTPSTSLPFDGLGSIQEAGHEITNGVRAAGGSTFSVVLKRDGRVVLVGGLGYAITNVPTSLSNVMAIAAGGYHCLALRSNGTVVCWGENSSGQTNVPPGLSNVVAVAAGSHHSLALRSDGTVVAWGWGDYGQTNLSGLTNIVAIAADQYNSLALRSDGALLVSGYNEWYWNGPLPVPPGLTNVVAAEGGANHMLALKSDGTVITWSRPHPSYEEFGQTNVPAGLSNVMAIAVGDYHNLALRSNGTVVAWGTGYWNYGQANVPTNLNGVIAITAGAESSAALKSDGTIVWWGRAGLAPPSDVTNVVAISAGRYFNLALTADGRVHAWGGNEYGQCNVPSNATNVTAISAGSLHSLALRANGTVVSWGRNDGGCTNVPVGLSNVVAIAAGDFVSVALRADGTAMAWGWNGESRTNAPVEATNIVAIATGYPVQPLFGCEAPKRRR